jgi:predicted GNAT family acetyltransferase
LDFKEGTNKFYLGDDEDHIKAVVSYVNSSENIIILDHTFVSQELRGQNIGEQLVKKVVDFARENNKKIVPECWFAEKEFSAHKEYQDVLHK